MSMNRHTVRSRGRRNTLLVIEQGNESSSANQSLWKWDQPVDNFDLLADRTNLGRWISTEDISGDKTSTIEKVSRRHGNLPRKLEL